MYVLVLMRFDGGLVGFLMMLVMKFLLLVLRIL